MTKICVITGASSGIGKAAAIRLAKEGWKVILGARRVDKINELATETGGLAYALDVSSLNSVKEFCKHVPERLDLLINNAGGALGLDSIAEAKDDDWLNMYQSNVLGLMRMTRELMERLIKSKGHIINITSIAGREVYANGAGYTAVKHAAKAVNDTLRIELNGQNVRITDIAPGLVETEFSNVRFSGDTTRAKKVYEGITALTADDIAECISWCVNLPWHVNIDELVVKPISQASVKQVARNVGL